MTFDASLVPRPRRILVGNREMALVKIRSYVRNGKPSDNHRGRVPDHYARPFRHPRRRRDEHTCEVCHRSVPSGALMYRPRVATFFSPIERRRAICATCIDRISYVPLGDEMVECPA